MPRDEKFKGKLKICAFYCSFLFLSIALMKSITYTLSFKKPPRFRNPYIENGPVAVSATRREQVMIVRFAVRMTFPLEEIPCTQLLVAMSTREVFWMPRFAQGCYHLRSKNIIKSRRISNRRTSHQLSRIMDAVDSTWPTIGFSQALQHPFWVVLTPWRLMSAWRLPSIESNWFCFRGWLSPGW